MLGLMPAWSGALLWEWENDFVWELAHREETTNVPILVCEDDCDLSCILIIAKIRKTSQYVFWDKLGSLNHKNWDTNTEQHSGILCLEAYTDEDWRQYRDNIATEPYGSPAYWDWVKNNTYEEHIRRLRNYMNPYMQNDDHIDWIKETNWCFNTRQYMEMLNTYRDIRRQRKISPCNLE